MELPRLGLPAEYELLLETTRHTPRQDVLLHLLRAAPDWERVLALGEAYNLSSLLYFRLRAADLAKYVPKTVLEGLREGYAATCGLNLAFFAELERLGQLWASVGVEVMVLKGAAVARLLYPDIGLRPFGDVDVLVRTEGISVVQEVLEREGYEVVALPHGGAVGRHCLFHLSLRRKKRPQIGIEVHWHIFPPDSLLDLPVEWFFRRRRAAGDGLYFPAPEALVLHSCLHFSGHAGLTLRDVWDLEWLLASGMKVDWGAVVEESLRAGARIRVFWALKVVGRLFDTWPPSWVLEALAPPASVRRRLIQALDEWGVLRGLAEVEKDRRALLAFLFLDGWPRKLTFLRRLVWPGVCWLSLFPEEEYRSVWAFRLKTILRGIRLLGYLGIQLIRLYFSFSRADKS